MRKAIPVLVLIATLAVLLAQCGSPDANPKATAQSDADELYWRNHHDTVSYVGIEVCSSCHPSIQHTFAHTGMGSSFDKATPTKAHFDWDGTKSIYDPHTNFHYQPYFVDSVLYVKEYRLEKGDTVFERVQKVDYIVGSGQHTNSHIYSVNGYLFQAPFTYYTQEGRLDFPPGFEEGHNTRFDRKIGLECMSCHNAMPTGFQVGTENKFNEVPLGIDCERCHGPGELHVAEKMKGIVVDTAKEADRSIVNPKRLSADLQMELCQRCHLQGNAILVEGKSFFDFKPGMELSEVMDVYLPRYENSEQSFIMASHADRLKRSDCYIAGKGDFNCVSCHNPHVSVRETNTLEFNQTCASCHGSSTSVMCTEEVSERNRVEDNCVQCHMPRSGSKDIPHVSVHDHWIRVPEETRISPEEVDKKLRALVAINNSNPSTRSKARAFLQQFEQFEGERELLDSAWVYIKQLPDQSSLTERVHWFYLRGAYSLMVNDLNARGTQAVLSELKDKRIDNRHAWTAYRIGEAYTQLGELEFARMFYQRAIELADGIVEFHNKLGAVCMKLGDLQQAEQSFQKMLALNPYQPEAYSNLGYVQLFYADTASGLQYFNDALRLDVDYEPARLNAISVLFAQKRYQEAKELLQPLVVKYPNNMEYQRVWQQLNR